MALSATDERLIDLRNIGVKRHGRWLVKGVDLTISRGEIVTLIGPNGSGKSTTAKVATGIIAASEGTLWRAPNLRISLVPQKLNIDWTLPLTVSRLMALTHKCSSSEIIDALKTVGADHLVNEPVQHLSGGEFQRVLLARAIVRQPDLLVLDEPVQGVDYSGQVSLYQLIANIRDHNNCGILMISHDLHVVMAKTDRVICLNTHMCCSGPPEQIAQNPQYQQLFGDSSSEMLAIYRHQHDHTHQLDGCIVSDCDCTQQEKTDV
ncbi:Zinc ABC transporter, ATP-binding protein ZnuC [hydrothermal vent metagenome]|uniref:Zinc ABC transporter, ATP-binding protein ZnuC n=1 Tax=hydrothermal vent metagenome TaxID=652676 RepID=A0A3B0TS07_9ZZZZ